MLHHVKKNALHLEEAGFLHWWSQEATGKWTEAVTTCSSNKVWSMLWVTTVFVSLPDWLLVSCRSFYIQRLMGCTCLKVACWRITIAIRTSGTRRSRHTSLTMYSRWSPLAVTSILTIARFAGLTCSQQLLLRHNLYLNIDVFKDISNWPGSPGGPGWPLGPRTVGPLLPLSPSSPVTQDTVILLCETTGVLLWHFSQSDILLPFGPFSPIDPGGPLSPGSPLAPACPGNPLSPGDPGGPGGPGLPGKPATPVSGLLRLAANWASCSVWQNKRWCQGWSSTHEQGTECVLSALKELWLLHCTRSCDRRLIFESPELLS